jgi:HlyD family secretion protein
VRQIRLNSQVLQNVVTYNVVIDVANPDETLLPGMTAFVNIVTARRNNVPRLPLGALRYKPPEPEKAEKLPTDTARKAKKDEKMVYQLKEGQAVPIPIKPGLADSRNVEVLTGDLPIGARVITEDNRKTKPTSKSAGGGSGFKVRMF